MRARPGFALTARLSPLALIALASFACADKAGPAAQVAEAPKPETVYVQQPTPKPAVVPLAVAPRTIAFNAIGDTARLSLPDGALCVAATDAVARVSDAGLVTAVSNGDTHLRCWLGDRNASVKIQVRQELARVTVVADEGLAMRKPGDSLRLSLARVDRRGSTVDGVRPTWRSLAPGIIRVDSASGTVVGVADSGAARIVGLAGALADTVVVEVGIKGQANLLSSTGTRPSARSRAAARANQRTTQQRATQLAGAAAVVNQNASALMPGGLAVQTPLGIAARSARPSDSLFMDPASAGSLTRQRFITPYLSAGFAEHRIDDQGPGGNGLAKTSGAIFGGGLDITTRGMLSFRLNFMTGTLGSDTVTVTRDRKMTQGSFDAGLAISPGLTVLAGAQVRRYETLQIERWLMLRAGGEATFNLGGGALRGIVRVFVLPLISLASDQGGATTAPSFGLQSELGIGFENRRISSSLTYDIERFSFPNTAARKEQFGALLFRFGYKFGW